MFEFDVASLPSEKKEGSTEKGDTMSSNTFLTNQADGATYG